MYKYYRRCIHENLAEDNCLDGNNSCSYLACRVHKPVACADWRPFDLPEAGPDWTVSVSIPTPERVIVLGISFSFFLSHLVILIISLTKYNLKQVILAK